MAKDNSDIEKTISHWISRSDRDFKTMIHLYAANDYHWAPFIGHLVIEKTLTEWIKTKQ